MSTEHPQTPSTNPALNDTQQIVSLINSSATLAGTIGVVAASQAAWRALTRTDSERFVAQQEMFEQTLARSTRMRELAGKHDSLSPISELADEFDHQALESIKWATSQIAWTRSPQRRRIVGLIFISALVMLLGMFSIAAVRWGFDPPLWLALAISVLILAALICFEAGLVMVMALSHRFRKRFVQAFERKAQEQAPTEANPTPQPFRVPCND